MIQEIAPHTYDPVYREKKPEDNDFLLYYEEGEIFLIKEGEAVRLPVFSDCIEKEEAKRQAYYLFSIDDRGYYLTEQKAVLEQGKFERRPLSFLRVFQPGYQAFAGVTGSQIARWKKNRTFCGNCGNRMEPGKTERSMVCPVCGQTEYPKICPAVIVAVKNKDRLLMTKYAGGSYKNYALVAGFVEVGETLEDCVRREVMEETGLRVKNIRYYKSQPWGFSDTQMVGFTAELEGEDTIHLLEEELAEAGWFTREEIVEYPPFISVGHEMMKAFKDGKI